MINKIKKAKIKAESTELVLEVFTALPYFFEEAISNKNSKKEIEKRYYRIANKLWFILP